jgi:hypothetical protein
MTFEPLYGVETALVRYPEPPRYVTRATYGARFIYGSTLLAGEAEYTTAHSSQDFPALNQTVNDTSDRYSLGVRTTIPASSNVGIFFRAGGRATQGQTIVTTSGVNATKKNPLRLDPYAGAGFQLGFGPSFALHGGATLIRNAINHFDTQYTLGVSAHFGNVR